MAGDEATPPTEGVVLWDFDGTLAQRPGLWSQVLVDLLDDVAPEHGVTREDLRPYLRGCFPWHHPERPHPELNDADAWWRQMTERMAEAYRAVGVDASLAGQLAARVRSHYLDAAAWEVFDDVRPVLERLQRQGWSHVVVSNHVPELDQLVGRLGLGGLVETVVSSAAVGYEKPHPAIFEHALRAAGQPKVVWMIGDSVEADVGGAEALGIPAILVRSDGAAQRRAADLEGAAAILAAGR